MLTHRDNDPNFYLFNRTLESVMTQTYQNYILVLVGDALGYKVTENCVCLNEKNIKGEMDISKF